MSTAAKSFSRPSGKAEGDENAGEGEEKEVVVTKKTRLVKASYVFEGPSTDKRYNGDYVKLKKELVLNAKTEGRALLALERGYAPTWMSPEGTCRPRARNEHCCSVDVTLTTGPVPLREFFDDDGKPFGVLSAAAKDIVRAAAQKAGCSETFLTGSLQEISLLQYSVSVPATLMSGVTVAPAIHKSNGDVVTKLKRPSLVVVTGGRSGSSLNRTSSSATCFGSSGGVRAEVKHDAPVSTADLGEVIGEGSIQGEFISGSASGFMQGTVLYARDPDSGTDGGCTFFKSSLQGALARLESGTDKKITIPLREEKAGVAPSLIAMLFAEYAHVIFKSPPGSSKLIKDLKQSLVYEDVDGKRRITGVTVKRSIMIHIVKNALKKHTDDKELFTPQDRIGFTVTPVLDGMDKASLLSRSQALQSAGQKPSTYNPTISISLTAEIFLKVRSTSTGDGKDSDEEEITEDEESEDETEEITTGAAASDEDADEEEEAPDFGAE